MPRHLKAFLFDIGSTLVSGPSVSPARQIAAVLGGDDGGKDAIARFIMEKEFSDATHLVGDLSRSYPLSEEQKRAIETIWRQQESAATEIEGASRTLTALKRKGYKLGVISDIWTPYHRSFCLACPQVVALLDCQILSCKEGIRKPSRALFIRAADRLGALPEETVMVGDTYRNDVEPAMELKFKTVWYLSRPEKEREALRGVIMNELARPDRVITDLDQLLAWVV